MQQLLSVEDPDNPTEIVIHVNMLKEGWDVTNLYTIVPLRAANSRTLVEQSIGRGLRLPYGKRTGVAAVDRLTIVSHDRFQEIIDEANKPGLDHPHRRRHRPGHSRQSSRRLLSSSPAVDGADHLATERRPDEAEQKAAVRRTGRAEESPRRRWRSSSEFERLPRSADLKKPEVQKKIVEQVAERHQARPRASCSRQ